MGGIPLLGEPAAPTTTGVAIRVLGPVAVVGPHGPAQLVGARQRAVIGLLALKTGTVVPRWRLVDALWGEDPPRTAIKSLHSHVARVRQAMDACGLPDVLVTRVSGYALALPTGAVDALLFEEYARTGRAQLADGSYDAAAAHLRDGLALWGRHEVALADAEPTGWGAAEVERLSDVRLAATEDRWEAELHLGRHAAAVGELGRLLVAHPLRERLVGLLMLARYRSGQHARALDAYRRLRTHLVAEFGVDPGPDLLDLHTRILRRDPGLDLGPAATGSAAGGTASATPAGGAGSPKPASGVAPPTPAGGAQAPTAAGGAGMPATAGGAGMPRPAQLPARVGHFTGRAHELAALDQLLDPEADTRIAVISGPGGIGKTALAVQWAHRVADRFPDGQLVVDLRGHEPGKAMAPADALSHMLRSLGVPPDRIPADVTEQAALYRSLLHDKRILVVLDNACAADSVLPLVPAGDGNLLVVTGRNAMAALATHHAVLPVGLDVLCDDDALTLLAKLLGTRTVADDRAAAVELARLCGRMPLALRIAAAKLASQPRSTVRQLAAELAGDNRLDVLAVEGDTRSVRTVFASAYRALSEPAARLFRLLGLHPGPTFTTHLAAALADLAPAAAERAVAELVAAHLATGADTGRYRFHDLIAVFAHQCATVDSSPRERDEAISRLIDWYVVVADAANRLVDPGRDRVTASPRYRPAEMPFPPDHHAALAFLDGERGNLLPVVRYAAEHGHETAAWQLTYLLTGFYDSRGHWAERIEMCRWGVDAARRRADPATEGLMRSGLGVACIMTRRFSDALEHLNEALPLMRASGDKRGEGHVYNNIAAAYSGLRRFDEAVDAFRQALTIHTANGHRLGIALALNNTGHTFVRMGRPEFSSRDLRTALDISREIGNPRLEAAALHSLGEADLRRGDPDSALDHLGQALAVYRRIGDRRYQAETLNSLAVACLDRKDHVAALGHLAAALTLTRDLADQHVEAITLNTIGQAHLSQGDLVTAREQLRQALGLRARIPDPYEQAQIHRNIGDLEQRYGNWPAAEHHWGLAIGLYRKVNATEDADRLAAHLADARPADPPVGATVAPAGATVPPVATAGPPVGATEAARRP